jgi:hypothetical protein
MFMDFTTLVMDALVNQAAKAHFMFGGQASVPMVLRTPHGGGLGAGPQHSQCLEAWFAHVPGLKIVCPSGPVSAYGLLRAAIADPDPGHRRGEQGVLCDEGRSARNHAGACDRQGRDAARRTRRDDRLLRRGRPCRRRWC